MQIIDVSETTLDEYLVCLEEWSQEARDGVCRKKCWYNEMKDKGLGVKLAVDNNGTTVGMIHYAPIEYSWVTGENLYFIYCIWVHGHKQGRGDLRKQGAGKALLRAAEDDVKSRGAKGIAAWGMMIPVFMRASWFKKHGYKKADRDGVSVLLWKPFSDDAVAPKWIKAKKKPDRVPGKVVVTALVHGWCTGIDGMVERAKKVCEEFGDKVEFREIPTRDKSVIKEWGLSDALFIDDKNVYFGPPLTYEKLKSLIEKKVKKC